MKYEFTETEVESIVSSFYGMSIRARKLTGEVDQNFHVSSSNGERFVFKISNPRTDRLNVEFQNAIVKKLAAANNGFEAQRIIPAKTGAEIIEIKKGDSTLLARMFSWIDGKVLAEVNPHSPLLLFRLGELCGSLCDALKDFDHPGAHRFIKWDPAQTNWVEKHLMDFSGEQKEIAIHFFDLFQDRVSPVLPKLRTSVNYNDANDYNVLVNGSATDPEVRAVIDFGDAVHTQTINELAIATSYAVMNKPDPLSAACEVVKGFHKKYPITHEEFDVIFPLAGARLLISVVCSHINRVEHPDNVYLQVSDSAAWSLLKKLKSIHPDFAAAAFRNACGILPIQLEGHFHDWVNKNRSSFSSPILFKTPSWLDLGTDSLDVGNWENLSTPDKLDHTIQTLVHEANSDVVLGRYNEVRSIYQAREFEIAGNDRKHSRTVHLGIDYFCNDGTPVLAMYDGIIHSFQNNNGNYNYGPTLILEHHPVDGPAFFTLYGHLSVESLQDCFVGKTVKAGSKIAAVGSRAVNGNWTPHLHFQIILNMFGLSGDFAGVCVPEQRSLWTSNSPDPWFVLTGEKTPVIAKIANEDIITFRKSHIGKNLSISYQKPVKMVRGFAQYLIDDEGQKYIDTVNNVAHVGHEHPRVVRAGQRQMAVINTNTRYLHENLVKFTEELLITFPAQLNVAFVVNSGSEANELAMRLAKNFTGQNDFLVSEIGYHGNTNGCIEISSYKFDGPGGKGKSEHVHVIPIPDAYRGLYTSNDAGKLYAGHVKKAVDDLAVLKRRPAALIFESVISCGGQVVLPPGFLKSAYHHTRAAGGVCIADEVQTGCGRAGNHYWAFQEHEVVPDIVTIGKPIGNGHPLGVVVTTQEIANAFKNGMEYFNTFGGNPVSCAIGLEVLKVIRDEKLQENALQVGNYLKRKVSDFGLEFGIIGDVRGPGLFLGVELVNDRDTKDPATAKASYFINRMRDKGILMSTDGPYNNVLKIKPPIIFSLSDANFLLEAMHTVCREDFMQV